MNHKYSCPACNHSFSVSDNDKKFNHDPKKRKCAKCNKNPLRYQGVDKRTFNSVITDTIEIRSMADGKMYSSKSKYYQSLKERGSHVTEAGEHKPDLKRGLQGDYNIKKEFKQALQQHLGR